MNLQQFLDFLHTDKSFADCIRATHTQESVGALYADFPEGLDPRLMQALNSGGIRQLYTHQQTAVEAALSGQDTVVVTPTASGKSLTYLLPIFQRKLSNPHSRSLLLFPTKALSQDQQSAINLFNENLGTDYKIFTFDGDTPPASRRRIMEAGDFVITNPDMLHAGILPHHTNWIKLFENLEYIVIDELHSYRGIFGSHVANLLRRLMRICEFYGSRPQFLTCSATIGNPKEHAEQLVGRDFRLIDENGAPRGARNIIFYNPPVVNRALGIRISAIKEAARLGAHLISNKISSIFFCRSRTNVELLYTYLLERAPMMAAEIRAYRGGYLPGERRQIESELREGKVICVVSTNALELGVDIGMLDVSVSVGFPGSVSSMLQQFGRAGRRQNDSLSVFMATSDGTDQYLAAHPDYFLESNPEQVMLNPDNILIVNDHIKCGAYELPFKEKENFGNFTNTGDMLDYLSSEGVLNRAGGQYFWMSDVYPASTISLRSGPRENFVIIDITEKDNEKTIGEIDYFSAPTTLHKNAIYMHQGRQYYVEELLWDDLQARVKRINVDYYTDAQDKVDLSVLQDEEQHERHGFELHRGEVMLRIKAVMFKKIKLESHENLGWGDIHLPEIEMHTQGAWILVPDGHALRRELPKSILGAVLAGVAHSLARVAPLFVLCDPRDIHVRSEVKAAAFQLPAIIFYDSFPGGMELSYRIMQNLPVIAGAAAGRVNECRCENGCPACTGIPDEELPLKKLALNFLNVLAGQHYTAELN